MPLRRRHFLQALILYALLIVASPPMLMAHLFVQSIPDVVRSDISLSAP